MEHLAPVCSLGSRHFWDNLGASTENVSTTGWAVGATGLQGMMIVAIVAGSNSNDHYAGSAAKNDYARIPSSNEYGGRGAAFVAFSLTDCSLFLLLCII
jgi:hypothetical protein